VRISFLGFVYLAIGVVVAAMNDYFDHLGTIKRIISALLAILLWPLVLLDVDIHID
jgi:hypothetical protein